MIILNIVLKQDRIIDAYTLYKFNAFTNPRVKAPEIIKKSTETNIAESNTEKKRKRKPGELTVIRAIARTSVSNFLLLGSEISGGLIF